MLENNEEMIRCLDVISKYMREKDESPLAAGDLLQIKRELEKLWKDQKILLNALRDIISHTGRETGTYEDWKCRCDISNDLAITAFFLVDKE